ncbi:MBL fold metallo-hydrolase, partial [Patescibacteria group bacterium]|nr:MBL fold metallo-hydrolase [Patescibacteria group bacterium]
MDIYWYGQACFKLKGKNATVVIDPYDPDFTGLKLSRDLQADVCLVTHEHKDHNFISAVTATEGSAPMVFSKPGGYEVLGVVITAINSFHDQSEGSERGLNTIFHLQFDGLNIVHLGDLGQSQLTEKQVALIGQTDILLIPVGGIYTINAKMASDIVSQLEPKIIIPMHYKMKLLHDDGKEKLKFDLEGIEGFLKEMGTEGVVPQPKLSITKNKLSEELQVVVLNKI